ncbi:septal ring lytic transglycosylase RlpA family protein [Methylocystis parvus]|uniref:septal ring lytic transglycosylase RlpA family protein n=1 Tax=Methylocystis parvus TaxID=134 RepID=UPI003C744F2F
MRSAVSREPKRLLMKFDPTAATLRRSVLLLSLASLAGCSSTAHSPRYSSLGYSSYGSVVDPKYGVRASPRVIADGEEVPKGGGNYMVGKPYKIAGQTYYPSEKPFAATGTASWYGSDFHGRRTANGEIFDRESISAAHPTMPLPSYARVTNLKNLRSIVVRVNDRGPYHGGRVMDVSQRVAEALDFRSAGTAKVKVEWIGKADMAGDDDAKLLATLRDDGQPATIEGAAPVMVASRQEPVRTAALVERAPEPAARPVVNDAPAVRPTVGETAEMLAYAPDARPEPLPETTSVSREEAAVDSDLPTHGVRSAAPAEDKVKSFQAAPLPPVRPASLGGQDEASVPTPPMRHALN